MYMIGEDYYFTYFVVFKCTTPNFDGPILYHSGLNEMLVSNGTMHLFDEEMDETIDAVEFLMHLPRNIFDVYDMDECLMGASYDTPHHIIVIPDNLLSKLPFPYAPTMIVLTDDCSVEIKQLCETLKPLVGVYYSNELSEELLKNIWMTLWKNCKSEEYSIVPDIDIQHILRGDHIKILPTLFIARQFGRTNEMLAKIYNSPDMQYDLIQLHWNYMARMNALISMANQGVCEWGEATTSLYKREISKEIEKLQISVVITLPGIPKRQMRLGPNANTLPEKERRIIRIIGTHRAIARSGILIELPCIGEATFQKYDQLEERCRSGTNNKYVWNALHDLGKQLGSYFDRKQIGLLKRAKDITIFSDFPLGLAILDGDEVPLQCYKNISYQPLTPLTRRFQFEILRKNQMYLGDHCKIAVAECIPNDEENKFVYPMSKEVCNVLEQQQKEYPALSVISEQINNVASMKRFIADNRDADILYISAHGHYDRSKNIAGIMIGSEFWMANEDLDIPPIVILSACHTSPRGLGCVTIADMFLRNGALAVLGTFIPVNAHRNLILMTRLFTYIAEAQNKNAQYKTLADAWSGIVASNAIHELMAASPRFRKWMYGKNKSGKVRAVEFQLERCLGRLRSTHIYSDTIKIIKEMLAEEGMEGKFGNILDENDYFPESFFYQFLGSPENIFLYNEIFDEYNQNSGTKV